MVVNFSNTIGVWWRVRNAIIIILMVPKQTIKAINENKLSSNRVDANFKTKAPNDRTLHRNKMKIMDGSKKRATLLHFRVWIWELSGCMLNQINTCFVVTIGSIFESRLRYWNKLKVKENSLLFFSVLQLLSLFFSINWLIKFKTMKYSKWCSSFFFFWISPTFRLLIIKTNLL